MQDNLLPIYRQSSFPPLSIIHISCPKKRTSTGFFTMFFTRFFTNWQAMHLSDKCASLLVGSCSQSLQTSDLHLLIYAPLRGAESQNVSCLCIVYDVSPKRSDLGQEKRCKDVPSQRPTFRLLAGPSHRLHTYSILRNSM